MNIVYMVAVLFAGGVDGAGMSAERIAVRPAGHEGFDVLAGGRVLAPIRLSTNGAITAETVQARSDGGVRLSRLVCKDPRAVSFGPDDFVSVELPRSGEPVLRFRLTVRSFDAARWRALFREGPAPFHFLSCSQPKAQVWHQRGWLNATPHTDPFPLLQDVHTGSPELSCTWNRNWSYLCPLGAHPIPMIGVWNPSEKLYVGYDFQGARATDQSERYVATAYCWRQDAARSFITLAYPYGGDRYGELVFPKPGDRLASWCRLIVDPDLPATEDPNERFQARLFARYKEFLPRVPARSDLSWLPGASRLSDFAAGPSLGLFGPGGETTFYPAATILVQGWSGYREMPIDAALRHGDTSAVEQARRQIEMLLAKYARRVTVDGDDCLFWEKPLEGAWRPEWGGRGVTTLHNTDGWYPARVLVELYRYDRSRKQPRAEYLKAIDGIYQWTRHFVWTRNEFADVPSSPFAIGCTLSTAFLLDYYFTFRDDPQRRERAEEAVRLADRILWRYLPIWAMDSDRFDSALDSSFLIEPNSGRDWAGLACANEVHWVVDTIPSVYVHTGDERLRWYLRGILDRWPQLYRPECEDLPAACGPASMTEGLGLFDGCGPGRGKRYDFGSADALANLEPVGRSKLRVVAGTRAAIACCKEGAHGDVADYRTDGRGACSFRIVSDLPGEFDVSVSCPFVDISRLPVQRIRSGQIRDLGAAGARRPRQAPSSLYLVGLRNDDVVRIGNLPAKTREETSVSSDVGRIGNPSHRQAGLVDGLPIRPTETAAPILTYSDAEPIAASQDFSMLQFLGDYPLASNWSDRTSFAGLSPGLRWTCGVPFTSGTKGAGQPIHLDANDASVVFVAYAPRTDAMTNRPAAVLDNGQPAALSGKPVLAWQGWPPSFERLVLLDRAAIPAQRHVQRIDPGETRVVGVTLFHGGPEARQAIDAAFNVGAESCARLLRERAELAALRREFATLPVGKIAILPGAAGGPAASFWKGTGIKAKAASLREEQLVDESVFNARRFPIALYLNNEDYPQTVHSDGDGKRAILRYLAGGGTLLLLASGPFPYYYATAPGGVHHPDLLLPQIGLPMIGGGETAPAGLTFLRQPGQEILRNLPASFPFGQGDGRIRSVEREKVDASHRYLPLVKAVDAGGKDYGDVACWIEFKTGPAAGGRLLYVWSSLQAGPHGNAILADTLRWVLRGLQSKAE